MDLHLVPRSSAGYHQPCCLVQRGISITDSAARSRPSVWPALRVDPGTQAPAGDDVRSSASALPPRWPRRAHKAGGEIIGAGTASPDRLPYQGVLVPELSGLSQVHWAASVVVGVSVVVDASVVVGTSVVVGATVVVVLVVVGIGTAVPLRKVIALAQAFLPTLEPAARASLSPCSKWTGHTGATARSRWPRTGSWSTTA
jgi:hypothetical protein